MNKEKPRGCDAILKGHSEKIYERLKDELWTGEMREKNAERKASGIIDVKKTQELYNSFGKMHI